MSDILIGKGDLPVRLLPKYGNRHGLVAGATGTGKTVSLLVLAEGFSRLGVPVIMADVKGDVAGLSQAGTPSEKIQQRVAQVGIEGYAQEASPVVFWDLFGKMGHPVRMTISEIGPTLLARMLELNDTQEGVLEVIFKLADDRGLLLLDLDDLRALLTYVGEQRKEESASHGLVSSQSVAAIQRSLLALEREGGDGAFGEPALDLNDLMRTGPERTRRHQYPRGRPADLQAEARIPASCSGCFRNCSRTFPRSAISTSRSWCSSSTRRTCCSTMHRQALQQQVEQVVRLIRSKGVGVYFCSQIPDDMPETCSASSATGSSMRLRAYTPRDQKAVRTAAETFVANPKLNVAEVLAQLAVGEALVSTLQEKGVPMPVERTLISPPRCRMGSITMEERATIRSRSPVGAKYDTAINRESAFELLTQRAEQSAARRRRPARAAPPPARPPSPRLSKFDEFLWGTKRRQGAVEAAAKSATRTVANGLGRQLLRGILGGLLGGKKG